MIKVYESKQRKHFQRYLSMRQYEEIQPWIVHKNKPSKGKLNKLMRLWREKVNWPDFKNGQIVKPARIRSSHAQYVEKLLGKREALGGVTRYLGHSSSKITTKYVGKSEDAHIDPDELEVAVGKVKIDVRADTKKKKATRKRKRVETAAPIIEEAIVAKPPEIEV